MRRDSVRHPQETPKIEHTEAPKEPSEYGVFWGEGLFAEIPRKEALIEHILYEKDAIYISAQPGVGKSVLALQMVASLTSGQPFLESFDVKRQCNVLYLQTEGDRAETIRRVKCMEKALCFDHTRWVHINLDGICLNTPEGIEQFKALAAYPKLDYDVIIIDPLYTTVKGSLSSDDVATDWIRNLRSIKRLYNCAFVILHHETVKELYVEGQKIAKSAKDLFGSTYWIAFGSYNFKLAGSKERGFTLTRGKERGDAVIDNINLKLLEPAPLLFVPADGELSSSELAVLRILRDKGTAQGASQLIQETQLSRATVYRVLRTLLKDEKIVKHTDATSTVYEAVKK